MPSEVALNIGLVALFIVGFLLWLDSPTGQPRGAHNCGINGCRWHRKDGK